LTLGLTSTILPLPHVEDLAETRLAQKIAQLPGVGLVSISGGQRPAVRVQANPTALAAYGLTLEALRTAIAAANVDQAKSSFDGPQQSSTIGANDQLLTSRDYRPLIIASRHNAPVTLADVADVQFELMLSVALVVMVIFLFLRTVAATIMPAVAVPLSLVGTFGAMSLVGFSLNNLSLMALTISLIAVLIPLLFMADVVGRLFREFAITLGVTILLSAVVSLTLTPMLCATLLRHTPPERQGRFYRWSERLFERIIAAYGTTLRWVLGHQPATLLGAVATLALTVMLYNVVPKGFFPVQDTGVIQGISDAPPAISFPAMATRQQALAQVILKEPAVKSLSSFIGVDGTNVTLNSGRILINLKPLAQRQVSASEVIRRLQSELATVQGITLFMQPVQDLTVEDRVSRTQYQYSLEDADGAELNAWAPRLVDALRARPELRDVSSD
jgi:multidrug efflux pump